MKTATGSHTGTGSWLLQRATALMLAAALPGLTTYFLTALPLDFAGWQALLTPRWLRVLMLLTALALALHAWVGMRDIFMDYVRPIGLRLALYLAAIAALAGSVAWLAAILWRAA
jgi:succinate dehydrogenase / fumarate reductase membrane anchor subunit